MFKGRKLLIVTKHKKEEVLAPLLERELGVHCIVASAFDTDALGTFTGEIERRGDAMATIRQKCYDALAIYDCDMAVASEGSFGPHPVIFMAPADDELVLFVDKQNQLEISARELSLETNFSGAKIEDEAGLTKFLDRVGFPGHAVIIRHKENCIDGLVKGINNLQELNSLAARYLADYGSFFIETDMRAMHNPTRMKLIAKAAQKLVEKIRSLCPQCNTPGFGTTSAKPGLPCSLCRSETTSTLSYIYCCIKCNYIREDFYPNGKEAEDPMYCNMCNP